MKRHVSIDGTLDKAFREAWRRRSVVQFSRPVEEAMRLWLKQEGGLPSDSPALVPTPLQKPAGAHVHITLPPEWRKALERHAAILGGRSVPDVVRLALALYVRSNGERLEFRGLEDWRFLEEDQL